MIDTSGGPRVPEGNVANPGPILNDALNVNKHQEVYGEDPTNLDPLKYKYLKGRWGGFSVAGATEDLTDDATNYIVVKRSNGTLTVATTNTNWNNSASYARVKRIVLASGERTDDEDYRAGPGGVHGQVDVSSGAVDSVNGQTGAVVLELGDIDDVDLTMPPSDGDVLVWDSGSNTWIPEAGGGGGGLTDITEALATASPNNTVNVSSLTVTGGTTNTDFALTPKGTGALLAQVPDGTATGGNKRGARAVDLQRSRSNAAQVASGADAFAVGISNTASAARSMALGSTNNVSGQNAFAAGASNTVSVSNAVALGGSNDVSGDSGSAVGDSNTVSALFAVAIGRTNTASAESATAVGVSNTANGIRSVALGEYAHARGTTGRLSFSSGRRSITGDTQWSLLTLQRVTTDATPTRLTSTGGALAAANQMTMPAHAVQGVSGRVVAYERNTGDAKVWSFFAVSKRIGAGTFSLIGTVTPTVEGADAGASAWAISVTADDTNKAIDVTVTGESSKTIDWVCVLDAAELID